MQSEMIVKVKVPTLHYFDELIGLTCAPDLLALGVFPKAKEITESFAAFNAVRRHLGFPLDGHCLLLAVGDGSTPRTAATFAFRSGWDCVAVDPRLHASQKAAGADRLWTIASRIEDASRDGSYFDGRYENAVVAAVHSHAPLAAAAVWASMRARLVGVVAIPCCVAQELHRPPDIEYEDWGIWSPERTVKVWRPN